MWSGEDDGLVNANGSSSRIEWQVYGIVASNLWQLVNPSWVISVNYDGIVWLEKGLFILV